MKRRVPLAILALCLVTLINLGCKKEKSTVTPDAANNPTPNPTQSTTNVWQMGDNKYTGGTSSSASSGYITVLTVSTVGFGNKNGVFSGSSLSFTFLNNGSGTYVIKSSLSLAEALTDNPSLNYLSVSSSVGTEFSNVTLYESQDSDIIAKVTLVNGKYRITVSNPAFLKKSVNVGTGVPGAPEDFSFICNEVF